MRVIMTGTTGFIGKHLTKSLSEIGAEIYTVKRSGTQSAKEFLYDGENIDSLCRFFDDVKPDGVIHLASLFLAAHKPADIGSLISSNVLFGTHLLEAAKSSGTAWFINTGTFWQNYENSPYSPVNLYAATKQAFQDIAAYYAETSELIFSTIKLNDTFGTDDVRPKLFTLWNRIADSGEKLGMSAGEQTMNISYIEDVTSAFIRLAELLNGRDGYKYKNTEFAVSNREKLTLKELANVFEQATNKKLNIVWGERPYREREVMTPWNKGLPVPGWEQKYTLQEAIKKMYSGEEND